MIPEATSTTSESTLAVDQVTRIQELVKGIRDGALEYAISKMPLSRQSTDLAELSQYPEFLGKFKCGLAKRIGDTLLAHDGQVTAVYLFEPTANSDFESGIDTPVDATVHLLVQVKTRSAALRVFMDALDSALTLSIKSFEWPIYANYRSVLDIIPITANDITERKGFGALLTSIFAPPIRICQGE